MSTNKLVTLKHGTHGTFPLLHASTVVKSSFHLVSTPSTSLYVYIGGGLVIKVSFSQSKPYILHSIRFCHYLYLSTNVFCLFLQVYFLLNKGVINFQSTNLWPLAPQLFLAPQIHQPKSDGDKFVPLLKRGLWPNLQPSPISEN